MITWNDTSLKSYVVWLHLTTLLLKRIVVWLHLITLLLKRIVVWLHGMVFRSTSVCHERINNTSVEMFFFGMARQNYTLLNNRFMIWPKSVYFRWNVLLSEFIECYFCCWQFCRLTTLYTSVKIFSCMTKLNFSIKGCCCMANLNTTSI